MPMGMVATSAHKIGRAKSAIRPSAMKVTQKTLRCIDHSSGGHRSATVGHRGSCGCGTSARDYEMQTSQANLQIPHEGCKDGSAGMQSGGGALRGSVEPVRCACRSRGATEKGRGAYASEAENELLSGNKKQEIGSSKRRRERRLAYSP